MNSLEIIETWYASQCDGDWEHTYGIRIDTLDNPGWSIEIDLVGTGLVNLQLDTKVVEKNDLDWYSIFTREGKLHAAGDEKKLNFLLEKIAQILLEDNTR